MFKKKVNDDYLNADSLMEGGGLSKSDLKNLKGAAINGSEEDAQSSGSKKTGLTDIQGFKEFEKYGNLFQDLTHRQMIQTDLDVISIVITYDSKFCIAIVNNKDEHFELQGYSLTTFQRVFRKEYLGNYIKMNLIEQNDKGNTFVIAYQDNGHYYVSFVDNTGAELDHLDINAALAIDENSKPITGFWEPLITAVFIPANESKPEKQREEHVFISVWHRIHKSQTHFLYSFKNKEMISTPIVSEINDKQCTTRNFPIRSFYSSVTGNCLTFYRQGHAFTVSASEPEAECKVEKITDNDLGNMYLLFDQALCVRSSSSILFFKIDKETGLWKEYERFNDMRGQIYFIKGNVRIQVTTDEKVYFYIINKETLQPNLENVMYNFMNSSQLMFGSKVRYGISFKANQPDFQIFTRKFYHNFKVATTNANYEGVKGANIGSMNAYVMAEKTKIGIYDENDFSLKQSWNIPSTGNDEVEILYMTLSDEQDKIGVALGRTIIKDITAVTEIVVYVKNRYGQFELEKLRDFDHEDACITFQFNKKNSKEIMFFTSTELFKFNYLDDGSDRETIYTFDNELEDKPRFAQFSPDQRKFMVTSLADILYVNMDEKNADKREVDFDDKENISSIQNIKADDTHFYVLANKKHAKLGFYLFSVDINAPEKDSSYYINWNNKLDIGNCDLHLMREKIMGGEEGETKNCIVVSYKCIGINTFNVFVIDLDKNNKLIRYWHEGYQLWESPVKGFLLNTNDFLILSKDGINVLALGEKKERVIKDNEGFDRMIHSLGKCNYLKIEKTNHLLFACQFYENRQICLQEQYNDKEGQTHFEDIFRIKVHEITLRELMLLQSIYACKTQSDICALVDSQPTPTIFFKVFLELGIKSMVSFLAFDSRSIASLLSDKNHEYFNDKFPVFYKNEDQRSAIDVSLEMNQIRSVNQMINYICKFQNSYVYSHLFHHNLVDLLNKGVEMETLFNSKVFNHTFDFDEWPPTNSNTQKVLSAYNDSIFKLRFQYADIFPKIAKADKKSKGDEKVFKIKYQLNILPSVSEENGQLMNAIAGSEELPIFMTDLCKDIIDYRWQAFAMRQHQLGALIHITYVVVLMWYIVDIFLQTEKYEDIDGVRTRISPPCNEFLLILISVCLLYPLIYDGTQMLKQGFSYLSDSWNYLDMAHISLGYYNVVCQTEDTWGLKSKIVMIIVILMCLMKTFFFMRIVSSFSYIVTMIINVVYDLKVFLLFFTILIIMFSAVFDVIAKNEAAEYKHLGPFMGNVMTTLRLSLGDFDFGVLEGDELNQKQHWLFWIIWVLMVIFSALIFLNFIIAEVSNSYANVKQDIDALIYKERAGLIEEAEDIMSTATKRSNKMKFPKYIVIRELEE